MLVLSRQRDETIMIGDDVEVTIVDIRDYGPGAHRGPPQGSLRRDSTRESRGGERAAEGPPATRGVESTAGRA
jgi:hypothetical protein